MGMNLQSCCHKCRVKCFHYRGEEQKTLLPFYQAHYDCMRENPANVETLEDQIQAAEWMSGFYEYPEAPLPHCGRPTLYRKNGMLVGHIEQRITPEDVAKILAED